MKTFVISDTHWGHGNIIKYANRPPNHDHVMIDRWCKTVGRRDRVIHLGDLIWNRGGQFWPALKRLPGDKWLLKGNHDTFTNRRYEQDMGFKIMRPRQAWDWQTDYVLLDVAGVRVALSHAPLKVGPEWDLNVHGHVHNVPTWNPETHVNVSVEVIDYTPQDIEHVVGTWRQQYRPLEDPHTLNLLLDASPLKIEGGLRGQ